MSKWLYEYDTGNKYGPASKENEEKYEAALRRGLPFFLYPAYGYELRMVVMDVPDAILEMEKGATRKVAPSSR